MPMLAHLVDCKVRMRLDPSAMMRNTRCAGICLTAVTAPIPYFSLESKEGHQREKTVEMTVPFREVDDNFIICIVVGRTLPPP